MKPKLEETHCEMESKEETKQQNRSALNVLMLTILVWGSILALGVFLPPLKGNPPWPDWSLWTYWDGLGGLVVLACTLIPLGIWRVMIAWRTDRIDMDENVTDQ